MRLFAISDLHTDYRGNRETLAALSAQEYGDDALIVAGDVSHDEQVLRDTLALLRERFAELFFVPGNHELWLRGGGFDDSLQKHDAVLGWCAELGVRTTPTLLPKAALGGVWVYPLLSWYAKPEESEDSLYINKPGEDPSLWMWSDEALVRWPAALQGRAAAAMVRRNEAHAAPRDGRPVVSFSHFLPRSDLIRRTPDEIAAEGPGPKDRHPPFNFSRVAGTAALDRLVRTLGARVHVYGHQHRNRDREVMGVRYVSHCLGYPGECGVTAPLRVW
ncbi:MAG: metallophosphoesterase [Planctomycetota bacterium]